jgi:thioredoxin reductase
VRTIQGEVVIVGAGPAGLSAAVELRLRGVDSVLLIDRERDAGGIPRHAHHQGYGLRDLHRVMTGPQYAQRLIARAQRAGVRFRLATQATGFDPDGGLWLTGPAGRTKLRADAIVLATGCRERPRGARLVAGTRPQGVLTTGTLQQLVYLAHEPVGKRAVIVGAEHVSYSALLTLAHAGTQPVAMTTEFPRHQSYAAFALGARLRFAVPLHTCTTVSAIHGRHRVQSVELTHLDSGQVTRVACDLVVFTANWIPDHELAVLAGAALDPGTHGPAVDPTLRTSRPGLFAVGNVLHGAETADVAALSGRHAAAAVIEHLRGEPWPTTRTELRYAPPLQWVVPNTLVATGETPPRGRYLLRSAEALFDARIELSQSGHVLHRERIARLLPGRSARLGAEWARSVDPGRGPVLLRVASARRQIRSARARTMI